MTAALRKWFLGDDHYWRAFGIDTPVGSAGTPASVITARFTVNTAGKTVTVDGTASTATASTVTGYGWDFGDGTTTAGTTATHTYPAAGSFTITLTVTDDQNATASTQQTVTISAPTAAFTWTASGPTATFDASTSTDVGATITGYRWDFGDGATGTGTTAAHTYPAGGTRPVTLTITDAAGNSDRVTQQVTVNLPVSNPVAAFTSLVSNQTATFDASASTTTNGSITAYAWTFGDGATGSGIKPVHPYPVGTWTATLTITDSQGRTATVTHPITVAAPVNQPPTAAFTATASTLTVAFSAVTSTDGDGTIAAYAWTFGDGGTGTGINTTHTYPAAGSYTVRLTVTDDLGAAGTTTKTVTVAAAALTDYLASTTASTSSTLVPASTAAVLQQFIRSPNTGEFYSSQVHPESDGVTESVRLSRMTVAGADLDQMLLTGAGHGTTFALEYTGGVMYVWLCWQRTTVGGPVVDDLVRFPYKAGTYTRGQVTGLTVKVAGPTYRLPGFDWQNGYAVIRTSSSTAGTYTRYKLTDVLAGNLTAPLNTVTLPEGAAGSGNPTLQGFATYAGALFRYTGAASDSTDRATNPPRLVEYDWATGRTIRTVDTSAFGGTTQKTEPEGLSVYDNGTNPVLFFGVTQGPTGGPHTYPTWWYPLVDTTTGTTTGGGTGGGTTVQPTGTGIVRWQDLTSTAKFSTKVNSAGTGNQVSFPTGTFEFQNFSDGTQTIAYQNFAWGALITTKGILGSGQGKTIFQMTAGTSNKAGDVPPQNAVPAFQSNNLNLIAFQTAGAKLTDCTVQWTNQGHLYNGVRFNSVDSPTVSNVTVNGTPGNASSPPGETFAINFQGTTGTATVTNLTVDGQNIAAAGAASNHAPATFIVKNFVAKNMAYSAGWASWHQQGPMTFTNWVATNCARHFNAEGCAGAITFIDPVWNEPLGGRHDVNYTWETGFTNGSITFKFTTATDWANFIAARTRKKLYIVTANSSGAGNLRGSVHVYVGGVLQTTTNYVDWDGSA